MKKLQLGKSDLFVSPLTVGCWSFGGDADSYWGQQEQSEVNRLVHAALDRGVNFFDTAFGYNDGRSEQSLGIALQGRRQDAVICNKIPIQDEQQLTHYHQTITDSLKRLQTDVIDVMMIHWPVKDESLLRANLEALRQEQQRGTIRAVGVSNFATATLEIAREIGLIVVANEFAYNLVSRAMEETVLPYCRKQQIGVLAYMPLMQGLLTGKFASLDDLPPNRRRTIHFDSRYQPLARHGGSGAEKELTALLRTMADIKTNSGIEPAVQAIAWLTAQPGVTSVIAGCRTLDQLQANADAAETELPEALLNKLNQASRPILSQLSGQLDLWQLNDKSRIW